MKTSIALLSCLIVVSACSTNGGESSQESFSDSTSLDLWQSADSLPELTPTERAAFDALNTLQVSTDEINRLYSTFAGIDQPCYPPDTTITITQAKFHEALVHFASLHCTKISTTEREELIAQSALAQDKYTLALCLENSHSFKGEIPMSGTWVILSVLNRRDVILVW